MNGRQLLELAYRQLVLVSSVANGLLGPVRRDLVFVLFEPFQVLFLAPLVVLAVGKQVFLDLSSGEQSNVLTVKSFGRQQLNVAPGLHVPHVHNQGAEPFLSLVRETTHSAQVLDHEVGSKFEIHLVPEELDDWCPEEDLALDDVILLKNAVAGHLGVLGALLLDFFEVFSQVALLIGQSWEKDNHQ